MKSLRKLNIPKNCNYIAVFLTLYCNMRCFYCINTHANNKKFFLNDFISGENWIKALNRLKLRPDLPITFQGGEPGLHPDFIQIINGVNQDFEIDILTNLSFDIERFASEVNPCRLNRKAPYPNIRVSYHPSEVDLGQFIKKVLRLKKEGFSVGVYGILHPKVEKEILVAQKRCISLGIDFRTKDFLGEYGGRLYGTYRYQGAVNAKELKRCFCRSSELIVGPDCNVYRCHHDLYKNFPALGSLLDPNFLVRNQFRECSQFGDCNPCDIKVKNNRFQNYGHVSVEIENIGE